MEQQPEPQHGQSEEYSLIRRCQKGDKMAFEALVDKYEKKVYGTCYRYLANEEDAKDAAQEAFFKAYTHIKGFQFKSSFSTWLYSIVSHNCMNVLRKRKGEIKYAGDELLNTAAAPEAYPVTPEKVMEQKETQMLVQQAIASLPEDYRMVVLLRDKDGFSYEEIAEMLKTSLPAVKAKLFKARQQLRKKLSI